MLAMGSTTLVTFLFECSAAVRTVELLGSWDNFSKPYHLKRDRRRGESIWSGCYTFDDIICDGDLDKPGSKRNGALKMGGTYWYYYKVDDDDEQHDPSEPSTTVCPLLPGQRLNVLEVPSEARSRSNSESSDVFTRNPSDKYLTPVPPKPLPSPRLGDLCQETYSVPMHSFRAPRSATYPSTDRSPLLGFERHARSASTSPNIASTAVFADFKVLKEKLASKRSASSHRDQSRNVRELQIGAPTLISTTAEDVNLVPLPSLQVPSSSSTIGTPQTSYSLPPPITAKLREFSPLGSHPIDPAKDLPFGSSSSSNEETRQVKRPRSHVPSVVSPEFNACPGRLRANSVDTRRTRHYVFPNEPWLSSPRARQGFEPENGLGVGAYGTAGSSNSAPTLQPPSASLAPPPVTERPTSSHGGDQSPGLRKSPLDKELPALPRYLVPAPLFACSSSTASPALPEEPEAGAQEEDLSTHFVSKSHFSTWSTDSMTFSSSTSDEDAAHSPTFSSLTSNCSDMGSPHRLSGQFTHGEQTYNLNRSSAVIDEEEEAHVETPLSASPPQLDQLRTSSFGPSLFNLDIHRPDTAPRRQAACFGLGFQGYSLPEDETTSKVTITEATLRPEPEIKLDRDGSVGHLEKLVSEFGFLGESVL